MVWPGLNFIVGAVVFAVIIALGLVLFVVPGIFLLVALVFWTVYVAVEDRSFVEGMQESWALTRGHRMRLFLLGFAVAIVGVVVSAVFGAGVLPGSTLGLVIAQIGSALTTVFSLATLAAAYDQLVALPAEETTVTTDTGTSTAA
jgi:membrane-anchored glycerophosphoryl diester phosphodiesterase (GDPDase)